MCVSHTNQAYHAIPYHTVVVQGVAPGGELQTKLGEAGDVGWGRSRVIMLGAWAWAWEVEVELGICGDERGLI